MPTLYLKRRPLVYRCAWCRCKRNNIVPANLFVSLELERNVTCTSHNDRGVGVTFGKNKPRKRQETVWRKPVYPSRENVTLKNVICHLKVRRSKGWGACGLWLMFFARQSTKYIVKSGILKKCVENIDQSEIGERILGKLKRAKIHLLPITVY